MRKLLCTSSYQGSLVVINVIERELLSLPPRLGSLGINMFSKDSEIEYRSSRLDRKDITNAIYDQIFDYKINLRSFNKTKQHIKASSNEIKLNKLREESNEFQLRLNNVAKKKVHQIG